MKKALIVDDSESNRLVIGAMVSEFGIAVVYSEDGADAVHKFALVKPEIVFIDQIMPVKNGSDAIKQMKLQDPGAVTILMSSLMNSDEISEIVNSCGADGFLPKPISFSVIEMTLRRYGIIE